MKPPTAYLEINIGKGARTSKIILALVELSSLKPHEEINLTAAKIIAKSIETTGFQKNPVIADAESGVILDGMHRWNALKMLKARYIAACLVNYYDERIKLGRWARHYPRASALPAWLRGWIGPPEDPRKVLEKGDAFIYYKGAARRLRLPKNRVRALKRLKKLEARLKRTYGQIVYTEDELRDDGLMLFPPKLSKKEVVELASKGVLLPPKSTRHEIPWRPLHVNVPLNLLKYGGEPHVAYEALAALVSRKNVFEALHGFTLDREYREGVLIFLGT